MPMTIRKYAGLAGWILALAVLLAGCTGGDDGNDDPSPASPTTTAATTRPSVSAGNPFDLAQGDMSFDEVLTAYKASIDDYTWPPGYVPDADAIFATAGPEFRGGSFQPGFQLTMLTVTNECAWDLAWLDARQNGNEQLEAESLDAMTTLIPELPRNTDDPGTMEYIRKRAGQAALGDPTLVSQFVNANCRHESVIWE